jgi:hypothetical protein
MPGLCWNWLAVLMGVLAWRMSEAVWSNRGGWRAEVVMKVVLARNGDERFFPGTFKPDVSFPRSREKQ